MTYAIHKKKMTALGNESTVTVGLSLGKDTQSNAAELWMPNSMPSAELL